MGRAVTLFKYWEETGESPSPGEKAVVKVEAEVEGSGVNLHQLKHQIHAYAVSVDVGQKVNWTLVDGEGNVRDEGFESCDRQREHMGKSGRSFTLEATPPANGKAKISVAGVTF